MVFGIMRQAARNTNNEKQTKIAATGFFFFF